MCEADLRRLTQNNISFALRSPRGLRSVHLIFLPHDLLQKQTEDEVVLVVLRWVDRNWCQIPCVVEDLVIHLLFAMDNPSVCEAEEYEYFLSLSGS